MDAVDDLGNTPIAYAAMNGHERLEFVSPLISRVHSQNKPFTQEIESNDYRFSCTFMLMQKNANINVQAHQELKTDLQRSGNDSEHSSDEINLEMKWRPAKTVRESRKVVPLFQVKRYG